MRLRSLFATLTLMGSLAHAAPTIEYRLEHDPRSLTWKVDLVAAGLDKGRRDTILELPDWGEWVRVDSLYLRDLQTDPPWIANPDSTTEFLLDVPGDWDGRLTASYRLALTRRGSQAQESRGLLPYHSVEGRYSTGFSINTLMEVRQGDAVPGRRRITLLASPGEKVITGWNGMSEAVQLVTLDHPIDNAVIAFGSPEHGSHGTGDRIVEVFQFGGATKVTTGIAALVQPLLVAFGHSTDLPARFPVRLLTFDTGSGGTRTDHGIVLGSRDGLDVENPGIQHFVAHEIFHEWLGGKVTEAGPDDIVWFKEGFTDYLALWHLAAMGRITLDDFSRRLLELDQGARKSSAFGKVAFADESACWRDGDGPNETLAYKGGALLAFFMDVELHRRGGPRLPTLIRDLAGQDQGRFTTDSIRSWLESQQMLAFYQSYIHAPGLPELPAALRELGYEEVQTPVDITYFGAVTRNGSDREEVTAVDPEGPAARAGLRAGDRIIGYCPTRSGEVSLDPEARTTGPDVIRFPYGLTDFEPGEDETFLDVMRDGEERRVDIEPVLLPWGRITTLKAHPERARRFFILPGPSGGG